MQFSDQKILLLPSNRSLKYEFMQIKEKSDLFLATFVFVSTKSDDRDWYNIDECYRRFDTDLKSNHHTENIPILILSY
jgi:hypothetical protein